MKIKATVRLNFIQPGAFLNRHELREINIEADNHSEIIRKSFQHILETENLEELFGMDMHTYSQDEEVPDTDVSEGDIRTILGGGFTLG